MISKSLVPVAFRAKSSGTLKNDLRSCLGTLLLWQTGDIQQDTGIDKVPLTPILRSTLPLGPILC